MTVDSKPYLASCSISALCFCFCYSMLSSSSPSRYRGVWPLVDPFRSHTSRSLFSGLPWFLLPLGVQFLFILFNLLQGILLTHRTQFCILSKSGVILILCNICIYFIICPNVSCCSSRIFYHSSILVFAVNEHYHCGIMPKFQNAF